MGQWFQIIVVNQTKKSLVLGRFYKALDHALSEKNYMSSYKITRIWPHEGHGLFIGLKFN